MGKGYLTQIGFFTITCALCDVTEVFALPDYSTGHIRKEQYLVQTLKWNRRRRKKTGGWICPTCYAKLTEKREVFITNAQATLPDGTIHNLSEKEARELMTGSGVKSLLSEQGIMDVTISWIEGTPGQILNVIYAQSSSEDEPVEPIQAT